MRVMTIFGTRPEIIRLSAVMPRLDDSCDHVTINTGQNFQDSLNSIFLKDLRIRTPDRHLQIESHSFAAQASELFLKIDRAISDILPDRILILGDTNSALSSIVAARRGVPVFHMEAGNRCYDDRVPEEINRRLVDHTSSKLLPYTENSRRNLLREGIGSEQIEVTGNPILEVINTFSGEIENSGALNNLGLTNKGYFLVTAHRAENVDIPERLRSLVEVLQEVYRRFRLPVIVSVHPRTRAQLDKHGLGLASEGIVFLEPLPFFDFIKLEKNALAVLSDSGTVQEECCIFKVRNLTLRDVTERPETIDCGSNVLCGVSPDKVIGELERLVEREPAWTPPEEYLRENVSEAVCRIVLGEI